MPIEEIAPILDVSAFPEEERANVVSVQSELLSLNSRCNMAEAALFLFRYAKSADAPQFRIGLHGPIFYWSFIAAKALVSEIFLLDEDMENLGISINKSPTLVKIADHANKRGAIKAFNAYFPRFEGLRHSAQHNLYGTAEKIKQHAPLGMGLWGCNLMDDKFETDFEGKRVSLAIGPDTVKNMMEVTRRYWATFPQQVGAREIQAVQ